MKEITWLTGMPILRIAEKESRRMLSGRKKSFEGGINL